MLNHESDDSNFMVIGSAAEGSIEARDDQFERLEDFTERLRSGEFHRDAQITDFAACVDGRRPEKSSGMLVANSAGGTLTYFVADHLTVRGITGDGSTLEGFTRMADHLKDRGVALGDHTDSHAHGDKTGCGANDRLQEIYAYIANRGEVLRDWASKLGIDGPDEAHERIIRRAGSTTEFSSPTEIKAALLERTSPEMIPELQGGHKEVVTVINTRKHTTLDRDALAEAFGPDTQAFNVDAWQFENAAMQLTDNEANVDDMVMAMAYYNLATAFVLSGPGMRVVVVE
jgi:hypothetical protein